MRTDQGAMSGPTEVFWADVSRARTRGRQGGERAVVQNQAPLCPSQNADTPRFATKRGFIHKVAKGEDEKNKSQMCLPKGKKLKDK